MNFCRTILFLLGTGLLTTGCQMGYLLKSAYNQVSLLNQRVDIEKVLQDKNLPEEERKKLLLTQEVREFAESKLKLNVKKNYSTYVKLDRPYVSYVVSASPKWKLESYLWGFPIIGKVPYKGYFDPKDADEEAKTIQKENFDVYVRGVSAYSTLGWFKDPLLSSMLAYKEHDLVNTIIHESVHATLYIKSEADFNERMASFLGNKGMELYYKEKEGPNSPTLKQVEQENQDDKIFSSFITAELNELENWYNNLKPEERIETSREKKFEQIKERFRTEVLPQLKTKSWTQFEKWNLNNARLIVFKTYMKDLSDFESLFNLVGHDFEKFLSECKKLEEVKNPTEALKIRVKEM